MRGLSPVAASGGHTSLRCTGLSLLWPLLSRSTGSRRAGSVVVANELSCSVACGIFPYQGSNLCPLHRQADSQPLRHQGSPKWSFLFVMLFETQIPKIIINLCYGYIMYKDVICDINNIKWEGTVLYRSRSFVCN